MDGFDLQALATNPAALAGLVFGLTSTIKRNISVKCAAATPPRKEPPAPFWWTLSALFGVFGALILWASGYGPQLPLFHLTGAPSAVLFGLASGLIAVIGRDAFKTMFGWIGGSTPQVQVAQAETVQAGSATVAGEQVSVPPGFRPLVSPTLLAPAQDDVDLRKTGEWPAPELDTGR